MVAITLVAAVVMTVAVVTTVVDIAAAVIAIVVVMVAAVVAIVVVMMAVVVVIAETSELPTLTWSTKYSVGFCNHRGMPKLRLSPKLRTYFPSYSRDG